MALVFKLMLAATLVLGALASSNNNNTPLIVIAPPVSDVFDDNFFGFDDQDEQADATPMPTPEAEPEVPGVDSGTTTISSGRGRHHGGGGRHHGGGGRGHHGRGHHSRGHHGRRHHGGDWSPEQKMAHVCSKIEAASSNNNGGWFERKMSRKLERLTPEVRRTVTTVMAARKVEMTTCCQKPEAERVVCAETMSHNRYDRVCRNEEPLCVWAMIKGRDSSNSNETVDRCCANEGTERYSCFTAARNAWQSQKFKRKQ